MFVFFFQSLDSADREEVQLNELEAEASFGRREFLDPLKGVVNTLTCFICFYLM